MVSSHTHAYTKARTSLLKEAVVGSSTRLQRDPTEAEQTNRGGLGLREMIELMRERNFKQPPGGKDKGIRKEGWGGRGVQAGGSSSCLAYQCLH